jgi:hypothetical protein
MWRAFSSSNQSPQLLSQLSFIIPQIKAWKSAQFSRTKLAFVFSALTPLPFLPDLWFWGLPFVSSFSSPLSCVQNKSSLSLSHQCFTNILESYLAEKELIFMKGYRPSIRFVNAVPHSLYTMSPNTVSRQLAAL